MASQGTTTTPSGLLTDHHREIEAACRALRTHTNVDDPLELIATYRRFETAMVTHFDAEEELLLPAYAEHFPATARQIREEHVALRARMMKVAIDVELHVVRAEQIEELLALLRAHASFEEVTLYRWADGRLDADATVTLAGRLDGSQPAPGPTPPMPAGQSEHTGYSR
jgi:hypothetical protein